MPNFESLNTTDHGFGIELEGFIVDASGKPLAQIHGQSSYLMLKQALGFPSWMSAELLSCQAEVKTERVHTRAEMALREILEHVDELNQALRSLVPGARFETVASCNMNNVPLIAADPSEGSFARVQQWSQTEAGREILRSTATCSMQLCVSEGLQDLHFDERRIWLQNAFGWLSSNAEEVLKCNHSDRIRIAEELLQTVKRSNFERAGLLKLHPVEWITRPDGKDLQEWYMAHSGVSVLSQMHSKDAHSIFAKGKMLPGTMDLICLEYRFKDAESNLWQCLRTILDIHENMLLAS